MIKYFLKMKSFGKLRGMYLASSVILLCVQEFSQDSMRAIMLSLGLNTGSTFSFTWNSIHACTLQGASHYKVEATAFLFYVM